ncbi:uncharacterized protein LOC143029469 [Oratosquilla oratoria]|uniref:uncharacterized protein LOC143029469 n=1 Tax=Oratosquilla oratoria TaxID=337810 RepID=UPI003F769C96
MHAIYENAAQLPNVDETQVIAELADYRSKSNFFSKPFVWSAVDKTSASSWWNRICCSTQLYSVASNTLQLPPTSASVKQSFSRHALVHSARRNHLTTDRAAKLVFIGQNLALGNMDDAHEYPPHAAHASNPPPPQPSTSRDSTASNSIPTFQLESDGLDHSEADSEDSIDDLSSPGPVMRRNGRSHMTWSDVVRKICSVQSLKIMLQLEWILKDYDGYTWRKPFIAVHQMHVQHMPLLYKGT